MINLIPSQTIIISLVLLCMINLSYRRATRKKRTKKREKTGLKNKKRRYSKRRDDEDYEDDWVFSDEIYGY